jgi:hypothetical protein
MDITKKNYIQNKKIDCSEYFGDEAWVILREPNTDQIMALRELATLKEREMLEEAHDILLGLIVDHSFYVGERKAEPKKAIDTIYDKPLAALELVGKYLEWAFEPFRRAGANTDSKSL